MTGFNSESDDTVIGRNVTYTEKEDPKETDEIEAAKREELEKRKREKAQDDA